MSRAGAKVTRSPHEAARLVVLGTPVVLVGEEAESLTADHGTVHALSGCDPPGLVAVMIGPAGPALDAAVCEMAMELFPWADLQGPGARSGSGAP